MNKPILLIDNYDSFTYNLYHIIEQFSYPVVVKKNDELNVEEIKSFDKIMISPGPGIPDEAGDLKKILSTFKYEKNFFGVCLGLQAIAEVFGGRLINLERVYHGISTPVEIIEDDPIFHHLPKVFEAGRYHSWVMDKTNVPSQIEVLVKDEQNEVMAIRIKNLNIRAVQFHPESVLTPHGKTIIQNWLELN